MNEDQLNNLAMETAKRAHTKRKERQQEQERLRRGPLTGDEGGSEYENS